MNISGKNIILTGASGGIGSELLRLLCENEDVRIIAAARDITNISGCSDKIYPYSADLSKKEDIDGLFSFAQKTLGYIDLFIANAGFAYIEKLDKPDWEHIDNIFSVNTTSVIYSLLKFNEQKGAPKHFVCTVSAVAFVPLHAYALYCSSKSALHQFIEAYRMEQSNDLTISAVYPIATRTSFFDRGSGMKSFPLPYPSQQTETVAVKIIEGIRKNKKRIYPSVFFRLIYPIGRVVPAFLRLYSAFEKRKTMKWLKG